MRTQKGGIRQPHLLRHPPAPEKGGLWKAGVFSLIFHIALFGIFSFNLSSKSTKVGPSVYRVTIRPFSPRGDGSPMRRSPQERPGPTVKAPAPPPIQKAKVEITKPEKTKPEKTKPQQTKPEKTKPAETQKGHKIVEGMKSPRKKSEKKVVTAEKEELSESQKESLKNLHEALEDIRKKAALDEIKENIARREALDKEQTKEAPKTPPPQEPIASGTGTGTGLGTGTGTGLGTGTGTAGSPTGGSPWGSPFGASSLLESALNDYYDMIWAKIKKEWTLPENLRKGRTDLEATIVIVIEKEGKIQKYWFEKKSGNALFDQRAMWAIKKAEPFPPIPKEFSDDTLEMGFRFHPD